MEKATRYKLPQLECKQHAVVIDVYCMLLKQAFAMALAAFH
jgi:hypothetical protein